MLKFDPFDGALLVDKPAGPTSHDIVEFVRSQFGIAKVGHAGTLDPAATGLLILLLGRGTKLSEKLMTDDKVYAGWMRLGETTHSYDADGEVTASAPVPPLDVEKLNAAAESFLGDQMQTPPMVSAVKKDGVPLYKLARKGTVRLVPRGLHEGHLRPLARARPWSEAGLRRASGHVAPRGLRPLRRGGRHRVRTTVEDESGGIGTARDSDPETRRVRTGRET